MKARLRHAIFGRPRDLTDAKLFEHISLVALLAWVGLGADGLSSSSYGPEEAFRTLGEHTYLALAVAGLMAFTVFVIAAAYSRIIEEFPSGGGGYLVASKLLGPAVGVVSGMRPAGRLRAHHRGVDRRVGRRAVQHAPGAPAGRSRSRPPWC